jgi:alpha-methylacyl-CoA racemase
MAALDDVRVLDLSALAPGPFCSMLLADFGADVVVVQRVGSDQPDAHNPLFRNKRSICLDLKRDEGRGALLDLARRADVVIEGWRPGVAARLGVDCAALARLNERLVYCSISGFGQTGPYASRAGHDIDYIALAGALDATRRTGERPAIPLNFVADYAGGGLLAAFSILVALHERQRTGLGQHVDIGMTDGVLALFTKIGGLAMAENRFPPRSARRLDGTLPHYDVYVCKDGREIAVGALEPHLFAALCRGLGLEDVEAVDDENRDAIRAAFTRRFAAETRAVWLERLGADGCVAPVNTLEEALADPQLRSRGMVAEVDGARHVGIAPKLGRTPGAIRSGPPAPGAHTDALLAEIGWSPDRIAAARRAGVIG